MVKILPLCKLHLGINLPSDNYQETYDLTRRKIYSLIAFQGQRVSYYTYESIYAFEEYTSQGY